MNNFTPTFCSLSYTPMSTELSRDRVPSSNILSVDHSIARADSGV